MVVVGCAVRFWWASFRSALCLLVVLGGFVVLVIFACFCRFGGFADCCVMLGLVCGGEFSWIFAFGVGLV